MGERMLFGDSFSLEEVMFGLMVATVHAENKEASLFSFQYVIL